MSIGEIFHPLLQLIAQTLVTLHRFVGGGDSGWSWAVAIVLLTVLIRALLFPLFVKQIKTQRAMAELQPKIKALQAKHKGDRETLNQELMKLYREHGANPLAGCLPLLLQAPVFIALYQVLHQLSPRVTDGTLRFPTKFGVSESVAESLGRAKLFGAPIATGFASPHDLLRALDASVPAVKIVAVVLIVAMAVTTFVTTKQMMARSATQPDAQQQMQQKIMLYVMPVMLALFGFGVAIGTLIYWSTTNVFSLAQQAFVMRRLGGPVAGDGPSGAPAPDRGGKPGPRSPARGRRQPGTATATAPESSDSAAADPADAAEPAARGSTAAAAPAARRSAGNRPGGARNSKRGKGQRRGGRR